MSHPAWSTLTHARLRAAQGDVAGARRIVDEILAREPGSASAERLRAELAGWAATRASDERTDAEEPAPVPGDPRRERARFRRALGAAGPARAGGRIARLEEWLRRLERGG